MKFLTAISFLVLLVSLGNQCDAQTVSPASFQLQTFTTTNDDSQFLFAPGTIMSTYSDGAILSESGTASISSGSIPLLKATATVSGTSPNPSSCSALAEETFYFEISGPVGKSIPIVFAANGKTSGLVKGTGAGGGVAAFSTYGEIDQKTVWSGFSVGASSGNYTGYPAPTFSINRTVLVPFNTQITVTMNVNTGAGDVDNTTTATIGDVKIAIEPSYAKSHPDFVIVFSSNAGI